MARKKPTKRTTPSLHPQRMRSGDAWYYEDKRGIHVYVSRNGHTTETRIPWSRLMKSAARCGWTVARSAEPE